MERVRAPACSGPVLPVVALGAAGSPRLWRGGARWHPSTAAAVFGYVRGELLACAGRISSLFVLPPGCAVLAPPRQPQKRDACGGPGAGPGPGTRGGTSVGFSGPRGRGGRAAAAGSRTALDLVEETCRSSLSARLRPWEPHRGARFGDDGWRTRRHRLRTTLARKPKRSNK